MEKEGNGCNHVVEYITITQFGHGDSTHYTYAQCKYCSAKSEQFSNLGLFEDTSLRKAQEDFNNKFIK